MKPVFSRFFTSPATGESTADIFRGIISDAIIEPTSAPSSGLLPRGLPIQSGAMAAACSVTANSRSFLDLVSPTRLLLSPRAVLLAQRSVPAGAPHSVLTESVCLKLQQNMAQLDEPKEEVSGIDDGSR